MSITFSGTNTRVSELMAQARLQPKTPQEQWSRITTEKVHTLISEMLN